MYSFNKKLKFAFITNNDFDGVGQTAVNLSNNLNLLGNKTKVLVIHKKNNNKNTILLKRSIFKRILLFIFNFLKKDFNELFGIGISTVKFTELKKVLSDTDVVIIYSQYKIISNLHLEKIFNLGKKVYLRPLDIEMATGGCHFNNFCKKYKSGCNNCPKIKFSKIFKFPSINFELKKKILNKYKPGVFVQNNHSKTILNKSTILKNLKKEVLYLSTNSQTSKLTSKKFARRYLNINKDEKIISFITYNLNSYFKGGDKLKKILKILDNDKNINFRNKIRLITLGNKNGFNLETKNIKWSHFDPNYSKKVLNYLLRASDVMVCPSLFDFGPHIVEEALMNQTPVVAFDLGSSKDFIKNSQNGYLIKKYDAKEFANSLKKILYKKKFFFNKEIYKKIKLKLGPMSEAINILNLVQKDLDNNKT